VCLEGIRKGIRDNKQATTGNLIAQLNPKIRGWANYHRHVISKETFAKVDHAIFCALWQWAKKETPKETHQMDKAEILYLYGRAKLGLLRRNPWTERRDSINSTVQGQKYGHQMTRETPERSKSL
jgi:hypothetical protein